MNSTAQLNLRGEIGRKLMHVGILIIPIVYYFTDRDFSISILIPISVIFVATDYLRFKIKFLRTSCDYFFSWMLRSHENNYSKIKLTGASYTLLAASIGIFFIPREIFILAFSILSISDTSASFIGRYFGKRKFVHKTFEGSLAFFITGLIIVFLTPKLTYAPLEYYICVSGVLFGTFIEATELQIDDNFITPISISLFLMIAYYISFPQLNILPN